MDSFDPAPSPPPALPPTDQTQNQRSAGTGPRFRGCLIEVVETLVLTLIIYFVIETFIAEPRQILQFSMEPTLEQGQYVLVDKLSPHFSDYKRGDVIVFKAPAGYTINGQDAFIKRVIGVPGDVVELKCVDPTCARHAVYVNGVKLNEPYVALGNSTDPSPQTGLARWVVPNDHLFVMGDHRAESEDSRAFGTIPKSSVIGRAWLRYWPFGKFGVIQSATYPGVPDHPSPALLNQAPSPSLSPLPAR